MRRFSISSKVGLTFILCLSASCSPFQEEPSVDSIVELEFTEPSLIQQNSLEPGKPVSGSLTFEVQEDSASGTKTLFSNAAFHEPVAKNVLFSDIHTGVLDKNVYKPKPPPNEEPCGIPGFKDCPPPTPGPNNE